MSGGPAEFIAAARAQVGVPFVHQGRKPGVALDCIGLVVHAATACGHPPEDFTRYGRQPNPRVLLDYIGRSWDRKPEGAEPEPGDLVLFYWRETDRGQRLPQHAGIVTSRRGRLGLVHAYDDPSPKCRRVVEVGLDETWRARVHSVWRLKAWRQS